MKNKSFSTILLLCALVFTSAPHSSLTAKSDGIEIGDRVLAYWKRTKLYYVGTAVEYDSSVKGGAYRIIFEDGDQAVVPYALIRSMNIKKGSKV